MNKIKNDIYLAQNLRFLMKKNNVKMSTLASRAKVNPSTLHNYVHGVVPRHLMTIKRLADFFEVSSAEVLFCCMEQGWREGTQEAAVIQFEIIVRPIQGGASND